MGTGKYKFTECDIPKQSMVDIQNCYKYDRSAFYVMQLKGDKAEVIFTEMSESPEYSDEKLIGYKEQLAQIHQQIQFDYLLLYWMFREELHLAFFSTDKQIRAFEFLDDAISEFGLVRGNNSFAMGIVSLAILSVQMKTMDMDGVEQYLMSRIESYYRDVNWIFAEQYVQMFYEDILKYPTYQKKRTTWAFVESTKIVPEGKQFVICSLENESGLIVTATKDTIVMIGCRGEVYDIRREKFENTYETTDEKLDVFQQMMEFIPEVQAIPEGSFISIDEIAKLCVPKQSDGIYAIPLKKKSKIFQKDQNGTYFLGRPGDYLAIRKDDLTDIYVIQKEIFQQTYTPVDS